MPVFLEKQVYSVFIELLKEVVGMCKVRVEDRKRLRGETLEEAGI